MRCTNLITLRVGPIRCDSNTKQAAVLATTIANSVQWKEGGNSTRPSNSKKKPPRINKKYIDMHVSTVRDVSSMGLV